MQVVRHCLDIVRQDLDAMRDNEETGCRSDALKREIGLPEDANVSAGEAASSASQVSFVGEVLARLCRRGHAQIFAAQLWAALGSAGKTAAAADSSVSNVSPAEVQQEAGGDLADRRSSNAAASTSIAPAKVAKRVTIPDPKSGAISKPQPAHQQQEESARKQTARAGKRLAEKVVCTAVQSVEDAAALEKLLEALLGEAARQLSATHDAALAAEAAKKLLGPLKGPVYNRSCVR